MNYSPLAKYYQTIELITMGLVLQRSRTIQLERLASLSQIRNALLIGEGDGFFLMTFLRYFPDAQVTVIESSEQMIVCAKERLIRAGINAEGVTFIHASLFDVDLEREQYDLVTTVFFLDNFTGDTAKASIEQLLPALRKGGYWIVSDFCLPDSGWRRLRAKLWLNILYYFFRRIATIPADRLPDIQEYFLKQHSLGLVDRQKLSADMLFSALYHRIG